jgi:alanine-glyoxylate transaminase/(R)-3-amino-2-methylpropionate-pyruvate transaminase
LNPATGALAKKLADKMPKGSGLDCTYIVNSGSEANDLAIMMARLHTKNYTVLAI